jgi:hypothetical protein
VVGLGVAVGVATGLVLLFTILVLFKRYAALAGCEEK